jgi:hypothetical protein
MLLAIALFVLFTSGCWLYSLTDLVLTPSAAFRGLTKRTWFLLVTVTFIFGAVGWLVTRRRRARRWTAADEAVARHPAGRSRAEAAVPRGPDDDPEFLRELDKLLRGEDRA